MKKLDKLVNFFLVIFIGLIIFMPISSLLKIKLGQNFVRVFMITFILFMGSMLIVSFNLIYKSFKKDKKRTIKSILGNFIIAFTVVSFINYIKLKTFDPGHTFTYSILFALVSFYTDSKILAKSKKN